jgi:hypothetical protein
MTLKNRHRKPRRPKTINHRGLEARKKTRKVKALSGFPAFEFSLCLEWVMVSSFLFMWPVVKWHHPMSEGAVSCN